MLKNWKKIKVLLNKLEKSKLSVEEAEELNKWYDSIHFDDIPMLTEEEFQVEGFFRDKYDDLLKRVARKQKPAKIFWFNYKAAAVAAILIIAGLFWFQSDKNIVHQNTIAAKNISPISVEDILPGHDGAVLSLSNGQKIVLDSAAHGRIAMQGNTAIENANGVLTYNAKQTTSEKLEYNTLTTPAGREYQLELPDGSKVWLNASSSISFPAVFSKDERRVTLQGEAFFEVAKSSRPDGSRKPFKIAVDTRLGISQQVEIEVLGTSFNVNAYANESEIKTTLVEGSVKLSTTDKSSMLTPSKQAVINEKGTNIISNVNMSQVLAWRNGIFYFDHTDINSILRQFSRWYDIDITSDDSGAQRSFSGKIDRHIKLVNVLKIMDLSNINYSMEGKKLIIKDLGSD